MSAGSETIMATFNDADDFNVTFNLSEKNIQKLKEVESNANRYAVSICVPLATAGLFCDHRHFANTSKDLQEWRVLIKHCGTHRMDGAIEK